MDIADVNPLDPIDPLLEDDREPKLLLALPPAIKNLELDFDVEVLEGNREEYVQQILFLLGVQVAEELVQLVRMKDAHVPDLQSLTLWLPSFGDGSWEGQEVIRRVERACREAGVAWQVCEVPLGGW